MRPSRAGARELVDGGLRDIADDRTARFLGKVGEPAAGCRGGDEALAYRDTPWVDWSNYWGTGDASSKSDRHLSGSHLLDRNIRGVDGALLDLEYQRMELIRFNLFDNATYETYLTADDGPIREVWPEMRLAPDDPAYGLLRIAADGAQLCQGDLIRFRTTTGICNDIRNPAMGSAGQPSPGTSTSSRPIPSSASTRSRRTATATASRCSSPTRR